jgi:hypothetical protein
MNIIPLYASAINYGTALVVPANRRRGTNKACILVPTRQGISTPLNRVASTLDAWFAAFHQPA